jgi:hypothetical protein
LKSLAVTFKKVLSLISMKLKSKNYLAMKNSLVIIATFFVLMICSATILKAATLKGESNTSFGNYELNSSNQAVVINETAYRTWTLSYPGANKSFVVICFKNDEGCCFIVRNDEFEIQYSNKDGNFGAELVNSEMRTIKKKEIMNQVGYEKFMNQQLLTSNPKTEEEYLGIIACFMPLLFS